MSERRHLSEDDELQKFAGEITERIEGSPGELASSIQIGDKFLETLTGKEWQLKSYKVRGGSPGFVDLAFVPTDGSSDLLSATLPTIEDSIKHGIFKKI